MKHEVTLKKDDKEIKAEVKFLKEKMNQINEISLIKEFLQVEENNMLFKKLIDNPSEENVSQLNNSFRALYIERRILKYLSGFIKRYAIDYDKRFKLRSSRYPLVLDKFVSKDKETVNTTVVEFVRSQDKTPLEMLLQKEDSNSLLAQIRDEKLEMALTQLSYKELEVLSLYYLEEKTLTEIAEHYGQTIQAINYYHKGSLKKIRKYLS
ncbi:MULTISPECIES: sigma-70 family RNA polymerase sigma factor [Bacillus]|uniref:Sigma-70 family RNA polymerase sigma factor n=2 Tax=Bacillus cereus group TaxID=86661 RepID=A0A2C1DRM5_BACCE|nr:MULTISPECIES: sigma-70 family RNA polymerase sigma factor [Bacillus cereus group]OFD69944.1 hypothetical protein BWGOE8_58650 [Bacillus mycoides]OFD69955.1 hypothetical protein BWGOE9_57890 [Bacillus mycoides]OFD70581.1 hypothetical protein BWGOE10_57700 [Bacillus mycoides]PGT02589.1 sigma-70 family RNA polymerase sigma factor [Bacillus cereus]